MRKGNTFKQGITPQEHHGTNQFHNTGVPLMGFKGVPQDQGRGQFGVPIPGQGPQNKPAPVKPYCHSTTKEGNPCKAAPVTGEELCVGHMKASGQTGD